MTRRTTPAPESLVQRAIVQYLQANGLKVKRRNVGQVWVGASKHPWGPKGHPVRFGEVGEADLEVELPDGRSAFLEVKAGRNKATEAQEAFLARQRARGCPAEVVRSVEDVQGLLEGAGVVLRSRVGRVA